MKIKAGKKIYHANADKKTIAARVIILDIIYSFSLTAFKNISLWFSIVMLFTYVYSFDLLWLDYLHVLNLLDVSLIRFEKFSPISSKYFLTNVYFKMNCF